MDSLVDDGAAELVYARNSCNMSRASARQAEMHIRQIFKAAERGGEFEGSSAPRQQGVGEELVGKLGGSEIACVQASYRCELDDVGAYDGSGLGHGAKDVAGLVEEEAAGHGRPGRRHEAGVETVDIEGDIDGAAA